MYRQSLIRIPVKNISFFTLPAIFYINPLKHSLLLSHDKIIAILSLLGSGFLMSQRREIKADRSVLVQSISFCRNSSHFLWKNQTDVYSYIQHFSSIEHSIDLNGKNFPCSVKSYWLCPGRDLHAGITTKNSKLFFLSCTVPWQTTI